MLTLKQHSVSPVCCCNTPSLSLITRSLESSRLVLLLESFNRHRFSKEPPAGAAFRGFRRAEGDVSGPQACMSYQNCPLRLREYQPRHAHKPTTVMAIPKSSATASPPSYASTGCGTLRKKRHSTANTSQRLNEDAMLFVVVEKAGGDRCGSDDLTAFPHSVFFSHPFSDKARFSCHDWLVVPWLCSYWLDFPTQRSSSHTRQIEYW